MKVFVSDTHKPVDKVGNQKEIKNDDWQLAHMSFNHPPRTNKP